MARAKWGRAGGLERQRELPGVGGGRERGCSGPDAGAFPRPAHGLRRSGAGGAEAAQRGPPVQSAQCGVSVALAPEAGAGAADQGGVSARRVFGEPGRHAAVRARAGDGVGPELDGGRTRVPHRRWRRSGGDGRDGRRGGQGWLRSTWAARTCRSGASSRAGRAPASTAGCA